MSKLKTSAKAPSGIEVVEGAGGRKSVVRDGLDVWEYVLVARGYDWDVMKTAQHLQDSEQNVSTALRYYFANPTEIDREFAEMERMADELRKRVASAPAP